MHDNPMKNPYGYGYGRNTRGLLHIAERSEIYFYFIIKLNGILIEKYSTKI